MSKQTKLRHLGLLIPTHAPGIQADIAIQFARRAEEAGVDSVWVYDRLAFENPEPLTLLGAIAAVTSRVRIGPNVLLPAIRPPALLAKMLATIDQISGGRLILGVGAGSKTDDFAGVETSFERRGKRLDEALEILKLAWKGGPVRYRGEFYDIDAGPIGPLPVQRPHPPIWVGGFEEPAFRRVARFGDAYLATSARGPLFLQQAMEKIRLYAQEQGRDPETILPAAVVHTALADDRGSALALAKRYFLHYRGPDAEVPPHIMMGNESQCLQTAREYLDAGAQALIIAPVTVDLEHLERICREIIPRLPVAG